MRITDLIFNLLIDALAFMVFMVMFNAYKMNCGKKAKYICDKCKAQDCMGKYCKDRRQKFYEYQKRNTSRRQIN